MANSNFELGPVHILPEMICEPVHDLVVWTARSKADRAESHRVIVVGGSALHLFDQLLDAAGSPPDTIELDAGLRLRPYYVSRSPSDELGKSAMVAFALDIAEASIAATALVHWASQHAVEELIVDGVEVFLIKGADIAVMDCERALSDE